ncbi:pyrroline-5-carboxylate reductase [Bacillus sp. CECT 9360]|uniref:pyrroline-5-carboxylate reductase n=1 Tax=Bacillus sp. CECT 9360 TaxID=2845821 RepID=UPI001E59F4B3|nr:pyrroline-5-carboxylate reductase [Bacillus sp. CECT 9360]CAH0344217.1 Pyrroline-5-carboxylate reductase [Bacillus sp. CECT 9360]
MRNIGFIGCGKMGQAMIEGIVKSGAVTVEQIMFSTSGQHTLTAIENKLHIKGSLDNREIARFADFLFLAVKPDIHESVIKEIKDYIKEDAVIITIAAGITTQAVEQAFGKTVKVVRTMPNTPSLVREGLTAVSVNTAVSEIDLDEIFSLLNSFGKTEMIKEQLMDAVPAISGSSPAYVYMFIEALADGAVRDGIPREQAYRMAAQAVLGAAKMVLETNLHPGVLKDAVCTPGGSTIEAVAALEENNFRAAVLNAMKACTGKSKALSQE